MSWILIIVVAVLVALFAVIGTLASRGILLPRLGMRWGAGALAPAGEQSKVDENVQFTVYRPRIVAPGRWYKMAAVAHLSERDPGSPADESHPLEQAREMAELLLRGESGEFRPVTVDSLAALPRERAVTFEPAFENFEFVPPRQSFLWEGRTHAEEFTMKPPASADGKVVRGKMRVLLGVLLVAELDLSITVDSLKAAGEEARAETQPTTAGRFRKIFVSYSRRDKWVVEQIVEIARAAGDEFLRDVTHIRSGEVWDERLKELIRNADIFQLFWSSNSMYSDEVRKEWEYALSLNRRNFIRPTFWENPLPAAPEKGLPPASLSRLNFYQIPLRPRAGWADRAAPALMVAVLALCFAMAIFFLTNTRGPDNTPSHNMSGNVNANGPNKNVNTEATNANIGNTNAGFNMNGANMNRRGNMNRNSNSNPADEAPRVRGGPNMSVREENGNSNRQ